jgi:hypothetical protein
MKKLCLFLCYFAFWQTQQAWAQESAQTAQPAKYALVIGNGNYTALGKLKNPVNDAQDVAEALKELGFTVNTVLDGDLNTMENAVVKLKDSLSASPKSYGFLFYAGHGVQSNGVNYLIPVGANIPSAGFLRDRTVSVQAMLNELNDAGNELNVVVLDACRDNPFNWARSSSSRGLTVIENQPADSIVVYATSAGSTALDGEGRNGLFTTHLLNNLRTPGLEVKEIFNRTGEDVIAASNRQQVPAVYVQFFGNAYFDENAIASPRAERPSPMPQISFFPATAKGAVKYGFMNMAFGLGSYIQGDIKGGVIVSAGYAASIGLIVWELSLSRADAMAGYVGPVGVAAGVGTLVFGFIKPLFFSDNRKQAAASGGFDIALVSNERGRSGMSLIYTKKINHEPHELVIRQIADDRQDICQ